MHIVRRKIAASALALACIAPASAQDVGNHREPVVSPTHLSPELLRRIFGAMAVNAVALERLTLIGQLCRSVSEEDAETIRRNAAALIDSHRAALREEDRAWADAYLAGVRAGAMQSALLREDTDEAGCRRFTEPGGPLMRIMTWTDKPQTTPEGLRASPRMMP